jgi:hypothetical protein
LDENAIDEFIIIVVPTFIGEGIPLLAPRHRTVALRLLVVQQFPDGVVGSDFSPSATRLILKPERLDAFMAAETKISAAMRKGGERQPLRWFQLVSGGETPQFLMLVDRADWAAYEESGEEKLQTTMEAVYGKDETARIMQDARSAVRSEHVETWQYRADLSFVPAKAQ